MAAAHFVDKKPGWRVVFRGNDGIEYTRTVAALTDLDPAATDCMVVTFDSPLPSTVVPLRLPTTDWLGQVVLAMAWVDQTVSAYRFDAWVYDNAVVLVAPSTQVELAKPGGIADGDSSSGIIAFWGDLPVLLGCVHWKNGLSSSVIGSLDVIMDIVTTDGYSATPLPPLPPPA